MAQRTRTPKVHAAQWSPNGGSLGQADLTQPGANVFGENVFSTAVQRTRLPKAVYKQLQETLDCARRARPSLILVTTSFYDPMPGRPSWTAFVAGTRRLLDARYELVAEQGMSEVWARR